LYPLAKKPTIKNGSRGDVVKYLQGVILCKAGGNISVDGVFGPQTDKRVRDLQKFFKLTVDGIVGPQTWGVIDYLAVH
jgi:peptidoglycan hydrolase-like protein with peptidoglycan-binding domain